MHHRPVHSREEGTQLLVSLAGALILVCLAARWISICFCPRGLPSCARRRLTRT